MSYKFVKELKFGDTGQEVQDLQNFIIEIHFQNVLVDGKPKTVIADGDFGRVTSEAVMSIKAKALDLISTDYIKEKYKYWTQKDVPEEWLEVDDVVNPLFGMFLEKWYEVQDYLKITMKLTKLEPDPEPPQLRLVEKVIDIEKNEIGTREDPPYNNTGERVNEYLDIGSDGELQNGGAPWCAGFQNWSVIKGCEVEKLPYKATYSLYTVAIVDWAVKKGIAIKNPSASQIKRGMWGFVHSKVRGGGTSTSSVQHIYLITGMKNGDSILTIEGNTNSQGGSEGNGVYDRIRPLNKIHCWVVVDWGKLYE